MPIGHLLNQVVNIYPLVRFDEYGKEVEGTPVQYKARFQRVSKTKMLPTGQLTTIDGIVYIAGDPDVDLNYRVNYGTDRYKVFSKTTQIDGQGNVDHIKLELIKWLTQ